MPAMRVTSYNKNGEEVNSKDLMINDENMYRILRKYIRKTENDNKVGV